MRFLKYPSIEQANRIETINAIIQQGFGGGIWCATNKVHGCFPCHMPVSTANGRMTISSIVNNKLNVKVKSFNKTTGEIEYKPVIGWYKNGQSKEWYNITFKFCTGKTKLVQVTGNHKFYNENFIKQTVDTFNIDDVLYTEIPSITKIQEDVLLGSFLGDGSFRNMNKGIKSGIFTETHSIKQEEYLDYKLYLLNNLINNKDYFESRYSTEHPLTKKVRIQSKSLPDFKKILGEFYTSKGKKQITERIIGRLSALVLAIWFCDDGYTSFANKNPRSALHTEGFTYKENLILVKALKEAGFSGMKVMERTDLAGKYYIQFSSIGTDILHNKIKYFVPASMQYKLNKKYRLNTTFASKKVKTNNLTKVVITKIEIITRSQQKYDIEVEDNHNYFVKGLLVSNSNYQFKFDGEKLRCGKRSGLFGGDGGNFYGSHSVYNNHIDRVDNLYTYLKSNYNFEEVALYGELFGGAYPHADVERSNQAKKVQDGVFYCPHNDFYMFDIVLFDGKEVIKFFDTDEVEAIGSMLGFLSAPVAHKGTLAEMLALNPVFEDPLYKYFDLPRIENNMSEGWVVRPMVTNFFNSGSRVILKNKNPKFCERKQKKERKVQKPLPIEAEELLAEAFTYITENRLRNVLSHGHGIGQRDFGRLISLFAKDVYGEFMKDNKAAIDSMEKALFKKVSKQISNEIANVIRPHWQNIVDQNF